MSNFLNEKNTRVTKETLIRACPRFAADPIAWYAMRAIMQQVQKSGLPKSYMIDVASDFSILHKYPADKFVYCIRDSGVQIFLPPFEYSTHPIVSIQAHIDVFGSGCHWYTWDINDVRHGDDYNGPQLRPCTAEEAYAYMRDVIMVGMEGNE